MAPHDDPRFAPLPTMAVRKEARTHAIRTWAHRLCALMALVITCPSSGFSADRTPDPLFEALPDVPVESTATKSGSTSQRLRVHLSKAAMDAAVPGQVFSLPLPEAHSQVVFERTHTDVNGAISWIAQGSQPGLFSIITRLNDVVVGTILTEHNQYALGPDDEFLYLTSTASLPSQPDHQQSDVGLVDDETVAAHRASANVEPAMALAEESVIDVLGLYNSDAANFFGPAEAWLANSIAVANETFRASAISARLRLVASARLNSRSHPTLSRALGTLTKSAYPSLSVPDSEFDIAFAEVPSLRDACGADLVTLLHPDRSDTNVAGTAWLGGQNGSPIAGWGNWMFSVVGSKDALTWVHEIGHNLGSHHNRTSATTQGAFPYSFGLISPTGGFRTVMAYRTYPVDRRAIFSNPHVECAPGWPCGIPNSEDNARSINNTRGVVASFRSTVVFPIDLPITLDKRFGSNRSGALQLSLGSGFSEASDIAVDQRDRVVAVGSFTPRHDDVSGARPSFAICRLRKTGKLDGRFASGGCRTIDTGVASRARAVAVQRDGKIVVVGDQDVSGDRSTILVVRLNPDGTNDPSFGAGGIREISGPSLGYLRGRDVAVHTDGKIVVLGDFEPHPTVLAPGERQYSNFAAYTLTESGDSDAAFGDDGALLFRPGTGLARGRALAIDLAGRMVAAGDFTPHPDTVGTPFSDMSVYRLLPSGVIDPDFGAPGVQLGFSGDPEFARARDVEVLSDGEVLVVGDVEPHPSVVTKPYSDLAVVRLKSNGRLKTSFGTGGISRSRPGSVITRATSALVQADGKIVVGASYEPHPSDANGDPLLGYMIRFLPDGRIDTALGESPSGAVGLSFGFRDQVSALAVQSNGRIISAGFSASCAGLGSTLTIAGQQLGTPGFRLKTPNGGEQFALGSPINIRWKSGGGGQRVRIRVSYNGGKRWRDAIANTANDGSELWIANGPPSTAVVLKIESIDPGVNVVDWSDASFELR